nr:hypothetical protein [Sulfurimonas sp. MAG313]
MRKELGVPKPLIDKKFKEDGGNSIRLDDYRVELFFTDICKFQSNIPENSGDIIFSQIDFSYKSKIRLPLGLVMGDSYDLVVKKITRAEDYNNEFLPEKIWKIRRNDGKDYLMYAFFEDDFSELISLSLATYDDKLQYFENE